MIMKRAKQILWLLPFYLLSLSVSPASAQLSSAAINSLNCTTRSCVRPTWHFSVQVKMPQVLVDKYSLGAYVYAADQLAAINTRFNAASTFSGDFSFDLANFTVFDGSPAAEVAKAHPGYDFALVYEETDHPQGGWFGGAQAILHSWCTEAAAANCAGTAGVFNATATSGLVHEFGHSRGAIDVYNLSVTNNAINGASFVADPGIMTNPYSSTTFDAYSASVINHSRGTVYTGAPVVDAAFPPSFVVQVLGPGGAPVNGVRIDLFAVEWGNNTVHTTSAMTGTSASNTWTLPHNPFAPGSGGQPWNVAAPNFLVRARGGLFNAYVGYAWLPLTAVGNAFFANASAPYVLTVNASPQLFPTR